MNEGKNNNEKLIWQDFLNYLTRQFTNHEMHHFERKVDKSAFDTEAIEGLEQFAGASMDNDIELLKDHINKRNTLFDPKPKKGFPIKSIAAIALLVIGSGIVISLLLNQTDSDKQQIAPLQSSINKDTVTDKSTDAKNDSNVQIAQNMARNTQQKDQARQDEEITSTVNSEPVEEMIEMTDGAAEKEESLAMADSLKSGITASTSGSSELVPVQSSNASFNAETTIIADNLIHPAKGDSAFTKELKQWLAHQELANEGEVQIELMFKESTSANNVIILKGITEEANKAIQFYIMNKTLWMDENQNTISEGEFVYSFEL